MQRSAIIWNWQYVAHRADSRQTAGACARCKFETYRKLSADYRMTRFLPRIWNDPLCGRFNEETEYLFAYHHATKHTYQSVQMNAHFLDWKNQPYPFRSY